MDDRGSVRAAPEPERGLSAPAAIEFRGVSKHFGTVKALDGVSFCVQPHRIHAIVGENGAGKTTLMRILYGAIRPDSGSVLVDGEERRFARSAQAIAAGIGMVSQHYSIIPELSCLENLMLGAEPGIWIDRAKATARAEEIAQRMSFRFDWDAPAARLSPAGAQRLEILKLLWREAKLMILDEPTAMLSPADSDAMFASLRELVDEGATILLVTHRLPEVMSHCEQVTVLRAGRVVLDSPVSQVSPPRLAEAIVGHALPKTTTPKSTVHDAVLEVSGLDIPSAPGQMGLHEVSLEVRGGEVVGIAGVDGSGQQELFLAIVGLIRTPPRTIRLFGQDASGLSIADRIACGLRLIPEDRHRDGIVEDWPLTHNAAIGLQRRPTLCRGLWVDTAARASFAEQVASRFGTRFGSLSDPMSSLSGGNQQRFVAARAIVLEPRLILAFQPARGLDIAATEQVYSALREESRNGCGVLVVSFDLDELLEHCDRIVAMCQGRLWTPRPGEELDRASIGRLMVAAQ